MAGLTLFSLKSIIDPFRMGDLSRDILFISFIEAQRSGESKHDFGAVTPHSIGDDLFAIGN